MLEFFGIVIVAVIPFPKMCHLLRRPVSLRTRRTPLGRLSSTRSPPKCCMCHLLRLRPTPSPRSGLRTSANQNTYRGVKAEVVRIESTEQKKVSLIDIVTTYDCRSVVHPYDPTRCLSGQIEKETRDRPHP